MNNQVEESIFYLLIFVTLKIICNLIWIGMLVAWGVIMYMVDFVYVSLKPRN